MHQHTTKLTDFGLSRRLQESVCHTYKACGVIPYMDPKVFNFVHETTENTGQKNYSYQLTKKSDIYSLGVLFWELTSGSPPFNFETRSDFNVGLILEISNGKREEPIPNTNVEFVEIYQSKYNKYCKFNILLLQSNLYVEYFK